MKITLEDSTKLSKKSMTKASQLPNEVQLRDVYQTPKYAVDLLIPFIPKEIKDVWEPCAGDGKIAQSLYENGFNVVTSDLNKGINERNLIHNFVTDGILFLVNQWKIEGKQFSIITNPPFSIKELFIEKSFEYGIPFAFLINADYSKWHIDLVNRGCEKIVPNRRISYITPNILKRIHLGEVWKHYCKDKVNVEFDSMEDMRSKDPHHYSDVMIYYEKLHNYSNIYEVPGNIMKKYSSSQFHSMWLTYGFNIGRTETFVDLPLDKMENF